MTTTPRPPSASDSLRPASAYGDRHAAVYDRLYAGRFDADAAVEALAAAAEGGRVLELGAGTGRLAAPLALHGVAVDGIEASRAMTALLRARPGGELVTVHHVDLREFDLLRHDYSVAVSAVSTLFMLTREEQARSLQATARHLRPGGRLFVEAFRPDPARFDEGGRRVETRSSALGRHVVRSRHDESRHLVSIDHELGGPDGTPDTYAVTLHYSSLDELDAMAAAAGLRAVARWHDWTAAPARDDSADPVSVYRREPADG